MLMVVFLGKFEYSSDIKQLAKLFICEYSSVITTFPAIYTALLIILIFHVTIATSE